VPASYLLAWFVVNPWVRCGKEDWHPCERWVSIIDLIGDQTMITTVRESREA
jgi:hypothetical protein